MAANPAGGLDQALRQVAQDLERLKAPFALLGGLAVSAIAAPRFTRDIDLALVVPDDTATRRPATLATASPQRNNAAGPPP